MLGKPYTYLTHKGEEQKVIHMLSTCEWVVIAYQKKKKMNLKQTIRETATKEAQVYKSLYECWYNDTNILRKLAMPYLFVSYLLPMRFWNHFPYPSALACVLSLVPFLVEHCQPGMWSQEFVAVYVFLFIGPLFEAFLTGVMYYWIPGGKETLCSYFYSEGILRLFVGNPISNLRALLAAGAVFVTAQITYLAIGVADAKANIEVARAVAEAAFKMAKEHIGLLEESYGRKLTPEEIKTVINECKETVKSASQTKTTVTGNLDMSSGKSSMNISHNDGDVDFQGSASVDSGLSVAKKMQQAHGQSGFGQEKK